MLLQFHHVDDVRHLYLLDHQYLVRRMKVRHQRLVCDTEKTEKKVRQLFHLVVNYLLVRQLLVALVVVALQNLDEQILDEHLTLVDVHLDVMVVVLVDVALHCCPNHHQIQMDYFRRVVDVALQGRRFHLKNQKRCFRHELVLAQLVLLVRLEQVLHSLVVQLEFHFVL
jgi:hypothetical protein